MTDVVKRIQEELDKKNVSGSRMMQDIGLSSGLWSQWKSGAVPKYENIVKVAKYLDIAVNELTNEKPSVVVDYELDMNERALLEAYRKLSYAEQIECISHVLKQCKESR